MPPVIALISKPPAPAVAEKVLARARACRKPVIACFLGATNRPPMKTVCSSPAAPKRRP